MTVSTLTYFTDWSPANGVNKNWSYDFQISKQTDVVVMVRDGTDDTTIEEFTDNFGFYPSEDLDSGYVVYPNVGSALAVGKQVRIKRTVPLTQTTEIGNEGDFRPEIHENAFDKLTQMVQQVNGEMSGTMRVIGENPGYDVSSALTNDRVLIFKNNLVQSGPSTSEIGNAQGYAQQAKDARDDAEVARDESVSAKNLAVSAKNDAEAAKTASESARDTAVSAKDTAVAAAGTASADAATATAAKGTAVGAAQTASDAADDAVNAKNAAETAASNASTSETNAGTSASDAEDAKIAAEAAAAAAHPAPIGSVIMIYGDHTSVAPGYLLMNGFSVTPTYPDLRAHGLARGWAVDGNGDPICPNMGGKFPRGWLPGQVIDSGRVFGTSQADAFQGHKHRTPGGPTTASEAWALVDGQENTTKNPSATYSGVGTTYRTLTGAAEYNDGVNGAPRVAAETRPRNETFTYWIKAYAADTDPGAIDLNELANDVNDVTVRVTALEPKAARYVSPEQAIVVNGTFTLTHGLGAEPSAVEYFLVCKTAELGYAVGQKIRWSGIEYAGGTTSIGPTSIVSSTQIIGRWGNTVPIIQHVTAGGHNGITAANWRLIVKAIP